MKRVIPFALCALCLSALAQEGGGDRNLLGAGRLVTIESSNVVTRAWRRDVVMVDGEGHLSGDGGIVGEKASTDAIDEAASNSYQVAEAAIDSMNASMQYLYSNTNNMATNCVMLAMHVAPETVNSNITGYVVETTSDGHYDHQFVWYDRVLGLKPIRFVTYSYFGGSENVKAEWVSWTTNGTTRTVNGRTWSGVHECVVERPVFARGKTCLDLPNEEWGGASGINWGDMVLTTGQGVPLYTGFVTNGVTGQVIYFDNGFLKPLPEGGEE